MACFAVSKCPVHSFNTFSYCFVFPTETEEYNPEERFVEDRRNIRSAGLGREELFNENPVKIPSDLMVLSTLLIIRIEIS